MLLPARNSKELNRDERLKKEIMLVLEMKQSETGKRVIQ
jgi:hypothetical protein